MQPDNPYATPEARLIESAGFPTERWSAGRLWLLASLTLAALAGSLALVTILLGAHALAARSLASTAAWLGLLLGLLNAYLLIRFKALVEDSFDVATLAWPVWLCVGTGLLLEAVEFLLGGHWRLAKSSWGVAYYGVLILNGLGIAWLGLRLCRAPDAWPSLRAMGWLSLTGGLMLASLILLVPAGLPLLGAQLAMALVFMRAARMAAP